MPTRNVVKFYGEGNLYHVYNRGVDRMDIFRDDEDYEYFTYLLRRTLSPELMTDKSGRAFRNFADKVDLCAYCLMPNHVHLLIYLKEADGITEFMRSVMTAYSGYFNKKYRRKGHLFQGVFLASRITSDRYFWHITRYIHLNPIDIGADWRSYRFSSIGAYLGSEGERWLHPEYVVRSPPEKRQYARFVADYTDLHATLSAIKHELAD